MINPNINKLVYVLVSADGQSATYNGDVLEVNDFRYETPKPGRRRLHLKYSIMSDKYYLTTGRRRV